MRVLNQVLLILALTFAVSATSAPLRFGPEVPLSAPELGEVKATASQVAVATDGKNYFVVWNDGRGGVFGARVAPDGTLLDPLNIFIGDGHSPAVVWTGQVYVVAWGANDSDTIWATRVGPDGELFESKKLADHRAGKLELAANEDNVILLSAGIEALAVVMDENLHVYLRRVLTADGKQIRDLDITPLRGRNHYLIVASTAGPGPNVYTFDVSRIGAIGKAMLVPHSDNTQEVSVASNGERYLIAFDRGREIRTQVVTRENTLEGFGNTAVSTPADVSTALAGVVSPRLAWRGGEYVMAYRLGESDRAQLLRLTVDGVPIGPPSTPFAATDDDFALTARRDGTGSVARTEGGRLRLGLFDSASLDSGAPFFMSVAPARAAHAQTLPAAEEIEGALAAAWFEESAQTSEIRLTYGGRLVTAGAPSHTPAHVDVVWDGEKITVLWHIQQLSQLHVRRYTRTLEPLDAAPVVIATPADAREIDGVAAGGGSVLVMWETSLRTRVAQVLGKPAVTIASERYLYGDAAPVWDGANFVVFWARPIAQTFASTPVDDAIVAVHVTREGMVVESTPIVVYDRPGRSALGVRASANGGNIVLAWPEIDRVAIGRFTGGPLENVRSVQWTTDTFSESLEVVALPDGGADLYWLRTAVANTRLDVEHERLDATFTPGGRTSFTIDVSRWNGHARRFDAAATGMTARMVYARSAPELGYVPRVVLRSASTAVRRRAVR
jgi:hypothetical protein